MGWAKKKRQNFFEVHNRCFFCNEALTKENGQTIDHVPARECFVGGIGPENYEFPACERCNNLHRKDEQAAAYYIRMSSFEEAHHDTAQLLKLGRGVRNNTPELMVRHLSANQKKRLRMDIVSPEKIRFQTAAELPIVGMPPEGQLAIKRFSRKLACALYYKHCSRPMPLDYNIKTWSSFYAESRSQTLVEAIVDKLPSYTLTRRMNTNIGEQFHYRFYADKSGNVFSFGSQFSKSIFVMGLVTHPSYATTHPGNPGTPHSDDLPN